MNQYNLNNPIEPHQKNIPVKQKVKFSDEINAQKCKRVIHATLDDVVREKKFVSSIVSVVGNDPKLQECTVSSIVTSALRGEVLNLSLMPQLGQVYFIPFAKNKLDENGYKIKTGKTKNGYPVYEKDTPEAQLIIGYKGFIQLAIRSGQYRKIVVLEIKQSEFIDFNPLTEELTCAIISDPIERDAQETVGYYANFMYLNGFEKSVYWTKDQMLNHADKFSSAFQLDVYNQWKSGRLDYKDQWKVSSFWYKDFDSMAKKTMIRHLISRWGIMSVEMQQAFEIDNDFDNDYIETNSKIELETNVIETTASPKPITLEELQQ